MRRPSDSAKWQADATTAKVRSPGRSSDTGDVTTYATTFQSRAELPGKNALPAPAHASLTVSEVIAKTLRQNPALQVRRSDVEAARAKWVAAGLLPDPQLVIEDEVETNGLSRHETVAWAMFQVPTGPHRRLRRTAAWTDVEASRSRFSQEVRDVAILAAEAAIEVQYWQQVVQLDAWRRELADRIATVQAARFEAGEASYRDRVAAELARAEAEMTERDSHSRLALAQVSLNEAMGESVFGRPEIRGPIVVGFLPPMSLEQVVARANAVMPEIQEGRLALAASQERWEAERWETAPRITMGPRFRDAMPGSSDRVGMRLAADLPVFDRNQGGVLAAAVDREASGARRYLLETRAMSEVTATFLEAHAVDSNLAYFERNALPLAESAARALQDGFDDRLVGALPLLELLEQVARIRGQHLDLQRRHAKLRARLELLLDVRLDTPPVAARNERLPIPDP